MPDALGRLWMITRVRRPSPCVHCIGGRKGLTAGPEMALCSQLDGDRRLLLKQAACRFDRTELLRSGNHFTQPNTGPRTLSTYTVVFDAFN